MKTFLLNLGQVMNNYPQIDLSDSFSKGQIESKYWLIEELSKITSTPGLTYILGGWYGILSALMFESNKFDDLIIRSFDIDPKCASIADTMNRFPYVTQGWKFKASTIDMHDLNYVKDKYYTQRADGTFAEMYESPNTIINTSCEHLKHFDNWWMCLPPNRRIIIQSNNYFDGNEHINCVSSLDEFQRRAPLREIEFSGELDLQKYKRFMLIGKK